MGPIRTDYIYRSCAMLVAGQHLLTLIPALDDLPVEYGRASPNRLLRPTTLFNLHQSSLSTRQGDIHSRTCTEQRLPSHFHNRNASASSPPFDPQASSFTFGGSNVERAGLFFQTQYNCRTRSDTLSATDANYIH